MATDALCSSPTPISESVAGVSDTRSILSFRRIAAEWKVEPVGPHTYTGGSIACAYSCRLLTTPVAPKRPPEIPTGCGVVSTLRRLYSWTSPVNMSSALTVLVPSDPVSAVTLSRSPRRTVPPTPLSCEARLDNAPASCGLASACASTASALAICASVTLALSACAGVDTPRSVLSTFRKFSRFRLPPASAFQSTALSEVPVPSMPPSSGPSRALLPVSTLARRGPAVMQAPVTVQSALAGRAPSRHTMARKARSQAWRRRDESSAKVMSVSLFT
jgi:hypothetical protein